MYCQSHLLGFAGNLASSPLARGPNPLTEMGRRGGEGHAASGSHKGGGRGKAEGTQEWKGAPALAIPLV